jgi:hypothetical protein
LWGPSGVLWSCGGMYLNLVGDDYKDKQCVMNYKTPRLKIILQTAVFDYINSKFSIAMYELRNSHLTSLHHFETDEQIVYGKSGPGPLRTLDGR